MRRGEGFFGFFWFNWVCKVDLFVVGSSCGKLDRHFMITGIKII